MLEYLGFQPYPRFLSPTTFPFNVHRQCTLMSH
nr:MAG TPA: hypothetical protein [Crassvirales sp.]